MISKRIKMCLLAVLLGLSLQATPLFAESSWYSRLYTISPQDIVTLIKNNKYAVGIVGTVLLKNVLF